MALLNAVVSSTPSSTISPEGMAKAMRLFGDVQSVTERTQLLNPADAHRLIAAVDADLVPCTDAQAATLVAELLGAYPGVLAGKDGERDFKIYNIKLHEAFKVFSFRIGKAIVHGGTGVPSKQQFRPQPSDVVTFGKAEVSKRLNVKTMCLRHLAEVERREKERAEEADRERSWGTPERRQQVVAKALNSLRSMPGTRRTDDNAALAQHEARRQKVLDEIAELQAPL